MRVIAGSAKGTRLAQVPKGVRPVSDMAREGIFSSLGEWVLGARVLDLYAGTGAMAIEALSRGAEHAVLVERDRAAGATIRTNLERARLADRADLLVADVSSFVMGDGNRHAPFDLVFADPPYDGPVEEVERALAGLADGWLSEAGWRVVVTRPTRSSSLVIPLDWAAARSLAYGDTLALIIRPVIREE